MHTYVMRDNCWNVPRNRTNYGEQMLISTIPKLLHCLYYHDVLLEGLPAVESKRLFVQFVHFCGFSYLHNCSMKFSMSQNLAAYLIIVKPVCCVFFVDELITGLCSFVVLKNCFYITSGSANQSSYLIGSYFFSPLRPFMYLDALSD